MSWYKDLQKRAAEVCEYNDLGFSIIGGHLEEHDRGYKGESREATDREQYMWEKFDYNTPKNPFKEINISLAEKIIIGNLVTIIAEVADAIENVGDLIQILISKQAI